MTQQFEIGDPVPPRPERRRRPRWALWTGVAVLLLVAGYVGLAAYLGGRVPGNTTVGGVDVGGLTQEEAQAALRPAAAKAAEQQMQLVAGDAKAPLTPSDSGVTVDVAGSLDGLVGFSLNPAQVLRHMSGGEARPFVAGVDEQRLSAAVETTRKALDIAPKEGSLSLKGGKVAYTPPVKGRSVDVAETVAAVGDTWPGSATVEAVTTVAEPDVPAEDWEQVKTDFADKAMSGPVTVKAGDKSFKVTAAQLAPALSVTAKGGSVTHAVDDKKLTQIVRSAAQDADVEIPAKDAVVTFSGSTPSVAPSKEGLALDGASIPEPVTAALTSSERTAEVKTAVTKPKFTTERARTTLPKGEISTFTTNYSGGGSRVHNIKLAARTLNGTYIPPGGTFSLNGILGERTPGKGYQSAGVIYNGRLTNDYGGGISQLSTTVFNAAFFAGVRLDSWTPHAFYISRYPEGREATIHWPSLDNKWTNTTDGGILVRASATDSGVTVTFMGTKTYDVSTTKSDRRNFTQPRTITDSGSGCVPQSPAPGFTVTVTRTITKGGSVVKRESYDTSYIPVHSVRCT